jgi:hypothetical protein
MGDTVDWRFPFMCGVLDLDDSGLRDTGDFDRNESGLAFGYHLWMDHRSAALLFCAQASALFCYETSEMTMLPKKSLEPTRVCALSSAVAVRVFWYRVAELGS